MAAPKKSYTSANQKAEHKSELPPVIAQPMGFDDPPLLRKVFFGSLLVMLVIMLVSGYNVGFHCDEMDMNNYGHANLSYYLSGGKDTAFLGNNLPNDDIDRLDPVLRYYGSAFEYIPVIFNKVTGIDKGPNEFNSRHIFIQMFAILAVLFSGLTARRLGGWKAALFTIWLLYLTPVFFGSSLFNSKDIPFCTGYIASVYFIVAFLEELPVPSWKTAIYLILALTFTIGTRIGGLMLLFFLFLFVGIYFITNKAAKAQLSQYLKPLALKLAVVTLGTLVLVTVTWPYVLMSPLNNMIAAFGVAKKFPMRVPLNFEGSYTDSLKVPGYYLPKFIAITVPVFILLAIVWGFIRIFMSFRKQKPTVMGLVLFSCLFPPVYAILSNVAVYSAWRHFLFIYPALCIVAAMGLMDVLSMIKKRNLQYAFVGVCALGMVRPVIWMVKNHPYEYTYFNELSPGYSRAFYEYETDYWKITMKNAVDWLIKNEPVLNQSDTVTLCSDMGRMVRYYVQRQYPGQKIKVSSTSLQIRHKVKWRYSIFTKLFLPTEYIERFYPPCDVIHSEEIEGMPETIVLKDTERLDFKAVQAFGNREYAACDSMLTLYSRRKCPDSISLFGLLSIVKAFVLLRLKRMKAQQCHVQDSG